MMRLVRKRTLLIAFVGLTLFGMDNYERRVRLSDREAALVPAGHASPQQSAVDDSRLAVPVLGVDRGSLVRSFTDQRGGGRRHEAIDIMAPRGTPVVAVEKGTIRKLFLSGAGGLTIYQLDPTGARMFYYAHLDRYAPGLVEGKSVERGEVIGFVGSSGNAPRHAPHLHFAITDLPPTHEWWKGTAVDPHPLLTR